MRLLRIILLLALAAPGAAQAAVEPAIWSRDATPDQARSPAVSFAGRTFDLVGLHWRGSGTVSFRTRSVDGRWSQWHPAAPEAEDGPDPDSAEARVARRWRLGNPWWTGPADRIEVRSRGEVTRVRAWFVSSPEVRIPLRRVSLAKSPAIVPRVAWSADERIRRGAPRYAPSLRLAIVHHTAGRNDYGPAASAAIVRAIELYHVRGNGWQDIGYNFLVDRYGQVFEGRYGGIERNVIGAHAEGFNTGSVGIAVIGNYQARSLPQPAEDALARLIAWRLDVAHVDPLSTVTAISRGNARYAAGLSVFLRAVAGHRDTGFTACPGTGVYRRLAAVSKAAAAIGLPKLYSPRARGVLGGVIRFTARLSEPLAWRVTVTSARGQPVARGSGTGSEISWAWSSAGVPAGRYLWTMEAGPSVRPASGALGGAAPLPPPPPAPAALLSELAVVPPVVSPNGDGYADSLGISYTLSARSYVTATVAEETGAPVTALFAEQAQSARRQAFSWSPDALADGRYVLTVTARSEDGRTAAASAVFAVDRTLSGLAAVPSVFSPNGDGVDDTVAFTFGLARSAQVTVEVRQAGSLLHVAFQGPLDPGPQSIVWDGMTANGPLPPGRYEVVVTAVDEVATVSQPAMFEVSG